ncbi:EAL domain-containing protein [Temperatibacter marinus]|uniref:EAL domain-containing protein n=1 Tax=Temperatibacter marinus TaxID=1456591 RepID=A0AA52EI05_9PROT|nr:EAL domain-containing protein [Temperatibacter marinus]WND02869.1 EAL domain-containing protein [Temperatibacter marinus]
MSVFLQVGLFFSYVIIAFAVVLAGPTYMGLSSNAALGLGFVFYVGLSQGTRIYLSHREKKALDAKVEAIEFNQFKFEAKIDELIEKSGDGDSSKMVEELKMLQTLLVQFVKKEKQLSKNPSKGAAKSAAKPGALPKKPENMRSEGAAQDGSATASAEVGTTQSARGSKEIDPVAAANLAVNHKDSKTAPEVVNIADLPDAQPEIEDEEEEIIELSESEIFDDELSGGRGDIRDAPTASGALDAVIDHKDGQGAGKGEGRAKRSYKKRKIRLIKKESQLLDVMRSGLSENRVDLYLQPIVGLPSRKATFFECFSRVRDEEGNIILPRHYIKLADSAGLSGTLDNLLLFRLIQLIRKMGKRKQNLKFFTNLSLSSLQDKEFFPQFVDYMTMNEEFSHRLVFELSKEDYEALPDDVLSMMASMGRKGFGFSLDQVNTVDLDIKDLQQKFVRYIKIDSKILETEFSENDLSEYVTYLRRNNIALIASRVEREAMVLHALDNNVEFAQGYLFSEPVAASEMDDYL